MAICNKGNKSEIGKIPFLPNAIDRAYYQDVTCRTDGVQPAPPVTASQRQYSEANKQFYEWLSEVKFQSKDILEAIENNLIFILLILKDSYEVSKVFETINNRGKPLSQMDLVKNHLIFLESENQWQGDRVREAWRSIMTSDEKTRYVGSETADTVLSAVVTTMFHPGRRGAGVTDFQLISDNVKDEETFNLFIRFLEISFITFRRLRDAFQTTGDAVTAQLTYLNFHASISGVLPLILCREFVRGYDEKAKEAPILEAIEKANFRLYGFLNASKRSDSHNIPLHQLAHRYFERHKKGKTPLNLVAELERLVMTQHPDATEQIVSALTLDDNDTTDFYTWNNCRYFLARWEQYNLRSQNFSWESLRRSILLRGTNDRLEIEHIIPRTPNLKKPGVRGLPPEYQYKEKHLIRRLGNLQLIPKGVNIALSNGTLEQKALTLNKESIQVAGLQRDRLSRYVDHSRRFLQVLESRGKEVQPDSFEFDDVPHSRFSFNAPTIEQNRLIAQYKTLCDLRETDMIRFALDTWMMDAEKPQKTSFYGVLSFAYAGCDDGVVR